ncbi:MAG: hypothetical protein HQL97_01015 [Magnetococcales bacterium]|nr:hypothetical protein [Magnetococcales bacterium]
MMACRFCVPDLDLAQPKSPDQWVDIPPDFVTIKQLGRDALLAQHRRLYYRAVDQYQRFTHLLEHARQWQAENIFMREILMARMDEEEQK